MIKCFIRRYQGFTLVEMAIVLIILGFVLGALLLPLQAQRQQISQVQTETTLENAKRAILGYAQAQGRLPCPATNNGSGTFPDDTGNSNPSAGGNCIRQLGFLPAATLGIEPTDAQGFALDAWNNRIMYGVSQSNLGGIATADFTTSGDMNTVGITILAPELRVCLSATGATATRCSGGIESNFAINNAAVVIYSLGPTGSLASGGADENANPAVATNPKSVFVSHGPVGTVGNEFDHIVTWISPYVLYNAMVQAGQLH